MLSIHLKTYHLKPKELIARDTFTGETMTLQTPEEFFAKHGKEEAKKPRRK
jgi:hypothetical protein